MKNHVSLKMAFVCEEFMANHTFKSLLTRVNQHVSSQVGVMQEALATVITLEVFLSPVHKSMSR